MKDNELYRAVMTLFGPVNTEHVHHEIRGLNIIIKLMKLITFHNWPRLLERKDSNYWLSYKFDSITKNKCESYKPHSQRELIGVSSTRKQRLTIRKIACFFLRYEYV